MKEKSITHNISKALIGLSPDNSYLVAVSGGVDSMVLLYLFLNSTLSFSVVHCNFQLRGKDSDLDEQLVLDFCKANKLTLFSKKMNTLELKKGGESIEMTARSLRYSYFKELINQYGFNYLVTAHHLNDNIETFFINLLRSSGLKGLSGMPYKNNEILRPLLDFSRREIVNFAGEQNIVWREDLTNQDFDYLRNKLRHKIIPEFEEINSDFLNQLQKSMRIIGDSYAFIEKKMLKLKEKAIIFEDQNIYKYSKKILKNADFILIYHLFSSLGYSNERDICNILSAGTGKFFISSTHKIWVDRDELIVEKIGKKNNIYDVNIVIEKLPFHIKNPIILDIVTDKHLVSGWINEMIDFNKISFPLVVRKWKEADFIYPINGNGKKKISKLLKDQKVSNYEKNKVMVLCDNSGTIIWLIGYRLDDRFKITSETQCVVTLSYFSS